MKGSNPRRRVSNDAFDLMRHGVDELEHWFEAARSRLSQAARQAGASAEWSPAVEAFQRGSDFIVRAELPGMTRDDVTVDVDDNTLTIQGERRRGPQEGRGEVFWSERRYGSFSRVIPLPPGVNADSAAATFSNGILEVVMPVSSHATPRSRRIDISAAASPKTQADRQNQRT